MHRIPRIRTFLGGRRGALTATAVAAGTALASLTFVGLGSSSAGAADSLLSSRKPATASAVENRDYTPASAAFDGGSTTRWASGPVATAWLQVDLGAVDTISRIELDWESAYAKAFTITTSTNGTTWSSPIYQTTTATGGKQVLTVSGSGEFVRINATARGTGYYYSLWEVRVFGTPPTTPTMPGMTPAPFDPNLDPGESVTLPAPNPPVVPSTYDPPAGNEPSHHEFQADCTPNAHHPDDPIVFAKKPGASHDHTFMGATTVDAYSTTKKLAAVGTSCTVPPDHSAYWFPTLYKGDGAVIDPEAQTVYYKSGVNDYTSVVPFPRGLRFVVGSPTATQAQFQQSPGTVNGFECGNLDHVYDIPATCAAGSKLLVRYQAPSCWDGVHLDTPDHKSHMSYPVDGHCTTAFPVAVPMLEFKISWPVSGDMSQVHFSSGRGYSWHYDFFNSWEPAQLKALVKHCINGGLQCNPRGFDEYKASRGYALDANFQPLVF